MNIGITINDVVRGFSLKVEEVHKKISSLNNDFQYLQGFDMSDVSLDVHPEALNEDDFSLIEKPSIEEKTLLKLSVANDPYLISHRHEFLNEEEFNDFMYSAYSFEINGRAHEIYPEATQDLNLLYKQLVDLKHTVTLVSQERGTSKQATLLFLAHNKFQGNNIKFLYDYSNIWELYDVIITANPLIILSKPANKLCLKITTPYNEHFETQHSFINLRECKKWLHEQQIKNK